MDPFPGNVIPASRLPGPLPWRISSAPLFVAQTVPIVLSVSGAKDSFYTSELALTNRGLKDAPVRFTYKAAFGEGSGVGNDLVPAGRQLIFSNGIDYLRSIGIPIPDSGNRGGTLTVEFGDLTSTLLGSTIVRTATARPEGRAGLAYPGIPKWNALPAGSGTGYTFPETPVYICGLRQDSSDRSNLAVLHAGKEGDGNVVLRVTIINGDPANPSPLTLPDITLFPGEFRQFNSILAANGLSFANGYVRIERVSGKAPYYAYGVINDEVTSDGSFVPPIVPAQTSTIAILSMVEAGSFTSELIATNFSTGQTKVLFEYVADAIQSADSTARFEMTLRPGEQIIIPNFVQWLREMGVPGVGTKGAAFAGALFATTDPVSGAAGIFLGARTSSLTPGGRYGLFYTAIPLEEMANETAWLYGLQQNAENRTNLALVATGVADSNPDVFRVELFDGDTSNKAATIDGITVNAKGWKQFGAILAGNAPGTTNAYAKITRTQGKNPFIAYAVINDGAQPGERTGDGAFVSMQVESVIKPNSDVSALAIDPITPATLFAGTYGGGVFKSSNGGDSWTAINSGLTSSEVLGLAIDPQTPAILYARTFGAIFKSSNGGESWSGINAGLTNTEVFALAIDPRTPTTLYAGTFGGVFKSNNGGGSWTAINNGLTTSHFDALVIDPQTPATLYAGTMDFGMFKSSNGGESWSAINAGLTNTVVFALAINPQTPTTLYAGTSGGVFKSTNGGGNWTATNSGLTNSFIRVLAIDPQTPATLYAGTGGGGVFKSTDGGVIWTAINSGLMSSAVLALVINPQTPATLYAGTYKGGVFKSSNGGGSWTALDGLRY